MPAIILATVVFKIKTIRRVDDWGLARAQSVVSNIFYFPFHIWDVILPIEELIFFNIVLKKHQSAIVCPLDEAFWGYLGQS